MVILRPLNMEADLPRIVELTKLIDNEETSVELVSFDDADALDV